MIAKFDPSESWAVFFYQSLSVGYRFAILYAQVEWRRRL